MKKIFYLVLCTLSLGAFTGCTRKGEQMLSALDEKGLGMLIYNQHTNLISTPARELLEKAGIRVFAREEVPAILNRDRSGMCPMDARIADAETPEECVSLLIP